MFCKNCGASLADGANFCTQCGASVSPASDVRTPDPEVKEPVPDAPQPTAPMYTPEDAYATYSVPEVPRNEADSILTWGIVGLVCSFVFPIVGIVFSAIAMSKAKKCLNEYGYLPQQAKTGRTLGIIGLVISIVFTVLAILIVIAFIGMVAFSVTYY